MADDDNIRLEDDPESGDYITTPCGQLGSKTCVSIVEDKFLGEYDDDIVADEAICEDMKEKQVFPSVWRLSDHGNVEKDEDFTCNEKDM